MHQEKWLEMAEIYGLGALDGQELNEFQKHMDAGCVDCAKRIGESQEILNAVPRSMTMEIPSPLVKTKLLQAVAAQASPGPKGLGFNWFLVSVAIFVALFAGVIGFRTISNISQSPSPTTAAPVSNTVIVSLKGLEPSPEASASIEWNPQTGEVTLNAQGLPQTPNDKIYELWAIAEGTAPIPAGIFNVDATGSVTVRLTTIPKNIALKTFAVTLEPTPGTLSPTGPMHLAGNV